MKPVTRVALVGAGAIAQTAHLPVLSKMRGVELSAICENDGHVARALADRFTIPDVFTDIDDLLDGVEVDAVVIATPNHLHEPHVLRALAARVAVLCERPLAMTSRGVERILAAANEANCMVSVANNHRFRNDVQMLDSFIRGGELGKLEAIRAGSFHLKGSREGWRTRREEAGGGAFFDYGVPLLDLALWLADFPKPMRVWAHMDRHNDPNAVEEAMLVQIELSNGVVFTFDVNAEYIGAQERWWFEVLSSRGSARLAPLRVVKELNGRPVDVSPTGAAARESAFIQSYRAELAHFVAMLRKESSYEPPSDQVLLHRTVEAIYQSAVEGREIRL
jgi:predicted dehydrogenase